MAQQTIEQLQKQLEEEKAAREDLEAQVKAYEQGKKTGRVVVPGEVSLKGETPTGEKIDGKYRIRPGHPKLRVPLNKEEAGQTKAVTEVVDAAAFMKVATGKKLNEEETASNPVLGDWKQDDAKKLLGALAAKGSLLVEKIGMILLLLFFTFGLQTQADAQIRSGRVIDFTLDTLTNADTLVLNPNQALSATSDYDYVWQFNATNLTGTSTGTCVIKESLLGTGFFINVDTFTISGTTAGFETGVTVGRYQKCECITSGTGTTQLKAIAAYRRKDR